jgi:ABC-type transport system involved in multi-copper enzyme maturation permease subunit
MINSIIQHELRQVILSRKSWFCFALLQTILGCIFNWLVSKYLQNLTMLDGKYGVTEEIIHPYYAWFCLLVLLFVPMITTQSICGEKVNKTLVNYRIAPISAAQFMLGKFLAINVILSVMLITISLAPLSIMLSAKLDWGQFLTSILGAYLLLNAAFAIGLACSTFMNNIARSNIVIFFILLMFVLFEWAAEYAGSHAIFLQSFGLLVPLKSFLAGIINVKHTAYYLTIILSFICLAAWRYNKGVDDV